MTVPCIRKEASMKKVFVLAGLCLLAGTLAFAQGSKPRSASGDGAAKKDGDTRVFAGEKGWKLVAYYLHGSYRCPTCISIERQSKETVETDFAGEIKAGKVAYLSLNYEEPENAHFGPDYRLMTKSLVLSLRKDGKEVEWKNLPDIWTTVHNPPDFRKYVNDEIRAMLGKMK